jgi:threonine synthase
MKLCSTKDCGLSVSFAEAVRRGVPRDGGLFIPAAIPVCDAKFLRSIGTLSFPEISFEVARLLLGGEIPDEDLRRIIAGAITFDAPLRHLDERTAVLELFHGPTLAFKDFGARFMARVMSYIHGEDTEGYTVLVATSGDTGSAVANGFHGMPGVSVVLLYPSGRVSRIQESQLTSLSGNVTALEIDGTFDDCQRLVRQAFADPVLSGRKNLTSANSINVARLLPQTFYYFNAFARLKERERGIVFSVPSGNLGNLTAGLIAWKMGIPVTRFIAATNANDAVGRYLGTGIFTPGRAITTLSNAMDVGDPGNLPRIRALFNCDDGGDIGALRRAVYTVSCTDDETREAIVGAFARFAYVFDPHGAVGYFALGRYRAEDKGAFTGIVLETAHPAKFMDVYDATVRGSIHVPERLQSLTGGEKHSVKLPARFEELKQFLMEA